MERSVDVETFLAIEEENLSMQFRKKAEPAKPAFDIDSFFKKYSNSVPPAEKEQKKEPANKTSSPYPPYTQKGIGQLESKTTVPDKKSGLMGWVEENPGTALLGSLLLAGAAYWLYNRYGRKKKPSESGEPEEDKTKTNTGRVKRRTRRLSARGKKKEENAVNGIEAEAAENNDAPEAAKEQPGVLTMAAAAAGGVIAGKILPDYRILAALATGAYALHNSDVKAGCIAAGLFFSPLITETVQSLIKAFTGSTEKKSEAKKTAEPVKQPSMVSEEKKQNQPEPARKETVPDNPEITDNISGTEETKPNTEDTVQRGIPAEAMESQQVPELM